MFQAELTLLWYGSIVMALFSIVFMLALILSRIANNRSTLEREERRKQLVEHLLLRKRSEDDASVLADLTRSIVVVAQTIVETSTMVRGAAMTEFLDRLAGFDIKRRLIKLLNSSNPRFRVLAAEALGHFPDEQARGALWNALSRPKTMTGHRVIFSQALLSAGEDPDLGKLLDQFGLEQDKTSTDMAGLFEAIVRIDPHILIDRAEIACDPPYVRAMMLKTLGNFAITDSIDVLVRDAQHSSSQLRATAIDAIGLLGVTPDDTSFLETALEDPAAEVRAEAAEAIGLLDLQEFTQAITKLVSDNDWDVRFRASKTLLIFGHNGHQILQRLSDDETNPIAARTAALTLDEEAFA